MDRLLIPEFIPPIRTLPADYQPLPIGDISSVGGIPSTSRVQSVSHATHAGLLEILGFGGAGAVRRVRIGMHIMAYVRYALLALVVLVGYSGCAQQVQLPDAPSHHRFFDRQNTVAFTTLAGLIAVDAVTTQSLTQSGRAREANPVWRPLVRQGWQGEMAASALGFGAALSVAYTFHKTGHHKLERWANWFSVGTEAGVDCHNLLLAARR